MKLGCILAVICSVCNGAPLFLQTATAYNHHTVMDPSGKYELFWLPGKSDNDSIVFEVQVRAQGWVGLGMSQNGGMAGADLVIMWVDAQNNGHISDRYGVRNGFPDEDEIQDVTLLSSMKNDTHLVFAFKRKHNTCDDKDRKISLDTSKMLWAYSNKVPTSSQDITQHEERGTRSVRLITPQSGAGLDEIINQSDVEKIDLKVTNVPLPHDHDTLYWCEIHKLPKKPKNHIIAYQMMIQPGNEKYVHHLVIYACGSNMEEFVGKPEPCFNKEGTYFSPMRECVRYVIAIWAVGGEPVVYPENMGFPIFGEDSDTMYVLTEMHYDNSDLIKDLVDSSGMRLYVTPKLRPIDVGAMLLSLPTSPKGVIVPPGQTSFVSTAYCSAECTKRMPADTTIHFRGGLLHSHLAGIKMRLRHIRDGVELEPMLQADNYDFDYQSQIILSPSRSFKPGDEFMLECTYQTIDRKTTLLGGESTSEEMCVAYMEYYPKTNFDCGISYPDPEALIKYIGEKNVYFGKNSQSSLVESKNGNNYTFEQYFDQQFDWNAIDEFGDSHIEGFKKRYRDGKQKQMCTTKPVTMIEMDKPIAPNTIYTPPNSCKMATTTTPSRGVVSTTFATGNFVVMLFTLLRQIL